jgi:predicted O-linked N-acetylglucosamine transferase (SPINDLY family)
MTLLNRFRAFLSKKESQHSLVEPVSSQRVNEVQQAIALIEQGNALEEQGKSDLALQKYRQASSTDPQSARAHLNIGNIHTSAGRFHDALCEYRTAISKQADYVGAHFNLGRCYMLAAQPEAAQTAFQTALALDPSFAHAYIALGNVQAELGKTEASVASYEKALTLTPDNPEIYRNLALTYSEQREHAKAIEKFERILEMDPASELAHHELIIVYQRMGALDKVLEVCRHALRQSPDSAPVYTQLLFQLSHDVHTSPQDLFAQHKEFATKFELPLQSARYQHEPAGSADKQLRVGIVSADLRGHAVTSFIEPLLRALAVVPDVELHIFYNFPEEDEASARLRTFLPLWKNVAALTYEQFAQLVVEDKIDILIDLSGHTQGHRLLSFARRPAPVQVSWLGYPGTTGLQEMDYFIADHHFLPYPEFDACFTEKLVRLPVTTTFLPFEAAPEVSPSPLLQRSHLTFGSFNRANKISREVVALWAQVLRQIPDARMKLAGLPGLMDYQFLINWFQEEGISADRLDFYSRTYMEDYLASHKEVDVCLDTFPYTGGTTTNHAMWMGVPTLTLTGKTAPGRQSAANLLHVGIAEHFVADSEQDFVAKAVWLNENRSYLTELRMQLRAQFAESGFLQPEQVALALHAALRQMWVYRCQAQPPKPFEVLLQDEAYVCLPLEGRST